LDTPPSIGSLLEDLKRRPIGHLLETYSSGGRGLRPESKKIVRRSGVCDDVIGESPACDEHVAITSTIQDEATIIR
jgi:hypothetical protein